MVNQREDPRISTKPPVGKAPQRLGQNRVATSQAGEDEILGSGTTSTISPMTGSDSTLAGDNAVRRSERLIDKTKNRRVSVRTVRKGLEEQAVRDPWDISTVNQLESHDLDEVLRMINVLREERDEGIASVEGLQLKIDELSNQNAAHQGANITLSGDLAREKATSRQLQQRVTQLQEQAVRQAAENATLQASLQAQQGNGDDQQDNGEDRDDDDLSNHAGDGGGGGGGNQQTRHRNSRFGTPLSSQGGKAERSAKLPDPPIFTDGKDPTWDMWQAQIIGKLEVNHDWYENEYAAMTYVASRVGGNAALHITPRWVHGGNNAYNTVDEMMLDLAAVYDNQDRLRTARLAFGRLYQGEKPFNTFYSDFLMNANIMGLNEQAKIGYLQDKVSYRLKDALATTGTEYTSLAALKTYFQRVDSSLRTYATGGRRGGTASAARNNRYVPTPIASPIPEDPKKANDESQEKATPYRGSYRGGHRGEYRGGYGGRGGIASREGLVCYTCGKPGHISRNCITTRQVVNEVEVWEKDEDDKGSEETKN